MKRYVRWATFVALCVFLGVQNASAKVIGVENGPRRHLWNYSGQYIGQFASWTEFRNAVAEASGLDPKLGDKAFTNLKRGFEYKLSDIGSGISQKDFDQLKADNRRLADENNNLRGKVIPQLRADLKKALESSPSWWTDWKTIILILLLATATIALLVTARRKREAIGAKFLVIDGVEYDTESVRRLHEDNSVLIKRNKANAERLETLEKVVVRDLYEHVLPRGFKSTIGTQTDRAFFKRAGLGTVDFKGIPHPVDSANINDKLFEHENDTEILAENDIEFDHEITRPSARASRVT